MDTSHTFDVASSIASLAQLNVRRVLIGISALATIIGQSIRMDRLLKQEKEE